MSYAVYYRPHSLNDVCGQLSVKKIFEEQFKQRKFANVYLLTGSSGVGKTTFGRIIAFEANAYIDKDGVRKSSEPFEIDGASNNGVDNIREIIRQAQERSLSGEYKVFIIDECHALSISAWNAFLKCLEEPPAKTIFILCTTDPQKIPQTILNRVMRFNLCKIPTNEISDRLKYICKCEKLTNYEEACDYLAKLSGGGMRDAIASLEKCANYSKDLSISNVLSCLGNFSYETMFRLTNGIIDGDKAKSLSIIDEVYNSGNDLKMFIGQYLDFVLDLNKYCLFGSMSSLKIPSSMEKDVKYATNIENSSDYYLKLVNKLLDLHNKIKNDTMYKSTIEIYIINLCKGV